MFCFHKYGEIDANNRQICVKCGKVNQLPCNHVWEQKSLSYIGGVRNEKGVINEWDYKHFILKCSKCGELTDRYH